MKPLPRSLLAIARDREGLVTVGELRAFGLVGRARSTALESGMLVPVHRGVYRIASHRDTFEARCVAACLGAGDGVLSGPTAGRIIGLRKVYTDDIHLISRRTVRLEGVVAHRTDLLGAGDVDERGAIRVLRPARLFCDLAWHLDDAGLESVFEQLLDRRLLSVRGARAAARRFSARGRPGSVRLRRVIESRPDWLRPADSDLEVRLWRALADRGLVMERQVAVRLDSGVTVHLDLADPTSRYGIEVDHVTWHGGRLDSQRDKRRDRELARLGWTVSRVTDEDVSARLSETLDQLIAIAGHCARRS
jgi:very-short-patch-repair endonuclease